MSDRINLLVLERVDPAQNAQRFYVLSIEPTLFGDVALIRHWGRFGARGREMKEFFDNEETARETLEHWCARKLKRGYLTRPNREENAE